MAYADFMPRRRNSYLLFGSVPILSRTLGQARATDTMNKATREIYHKEIVLDGEKEYPANQKFEYSFQIQAPKVDDAVEFQIPKAQRRKIWITCVT